MSPGEWLAVAMFAAFILLIFTGYPVAWVLGDDGQRREQHGETAEHPDRKSVV